MKCQPIISVLHRENDELFVIFRVGGLMFNWWNSVHAKKYLWKGIHETIWHGVVCTTLPAGICLYHDLTS